MICVFLPFPHPPAGGPSAFGILQRATGGSVSPLSWFLCPAPLTAGLLVIGRFWSHLLLFVFPLLLLLQAQLIVLRPVSTAFQAPQCLGTPPPTRLTSNPANPHMLFSSEYAVMYLLVSSSTRGQHGAHSWVSKYRGVSRYHSDTVIDFSSLQVYLFLKIFFNIYLFLRDRDRARVGEEQRERETQNLKRAPGSELSAQSPTRGSNSRTTRSRPELKSDAQPTEPPGHPMTSVTF